MKSNDKFKQALMLNKYSLLINFTTNRVCNCQLSRW